MAPARQEDAGGAAFGGVVVDEDVDVFDAGEVADDFGVDPGDGLEFSGPVFGVVGPGDPGGGVGSPLGGHAVAGWLGRCSVGTPPTLYLSVQSLRLRDFRSGLPRLSAEFVTCGEWHGRWVSFVKYNGVGGRKKVHQGAGKGRSLLPNEHRS